MTIEFSAFTEVYLLLEELCDFAKLLMSRNYAKSIILISVLPIQYQKLCVSASCPPPSGRDKHMQKQALYWNNMIS